MKVSMRLADRPTCLGSGPEVLYFGRAVVLAFLLGGLIFLRASFPKYPKANERRWPAGTATLLLIVVIQLNVRNLLVARPESVALALYIFVRLGMVQTRILPWVQFGSGFGACDLRQSSVGAPGIRSSPASREGPSFA